MIEINERLVKLTILLLGIMNMAFSPNTNTSIWKKSNNGIYESEIECIQINPQNNNEIYVGTSKALYKSNNKGRDYKIVLQVQGDQRAINSIYILREDSKRVYAATDAGLYKSNNSGLNWQKIYHSSDDDYKRCFSVLEDNGIIYLGTQDGLFYKNINDNVWNRIKGDLAKDPIYIIKNDGRFIYVSKENEIFSLSKGDFNSKKIFSIYSAQKNNQSDENGNLAFDNRLIHSIELLDNPKDTLLISSYNGIYCTSDFGSKWHRINSNNIPVKEITSLLAIKEEKNNSKANTSSNIVNGHGTCTDPLDCMILLAGTSRGAFLYMDGKWSPTYKGMETNKIVSLANDANGTIYAATDRGVFNLPLRQALPSLKREFTKEEDAIKQVLENNFKNEPTVKQVHDWAINYAEVSNKKIKKWRKLARRKAWLPKVTMGIDQDKNKTLSDSIYGSYSSGGQHYIAPDDKTFYDNFAWDVSVSWDFADLIWNSDQTSIDSRSKMMVELREDILDQVTRLYFERRRIQVELLTVELDYQMKIDKQMRIDELTSLIDAFTGGEFSSHNKQPHRKISEERRTLR